MRTIALWIPAVVSVGIRHMRNEKLGWGMPAVLIEYGIYLLIDNFVPAVILAFRSNTSDSAVWALDGFSFFAKYIATAVIVAVLAPYMEEMIRKYIKITFTVEAKDEKKENNTKSNQ